MLFFETIKQQGILARLMYLNAEDISDTSKLFETSIIESHEGSSKLYRDLTSDFGIRSSLAN